MEREERGQRRLLEAHPQLVRTRNILSIKTSDSTSALLPFSQPLPASHMASPPIGGSPFWMPSSRGDAVTESFGWFDIGTHV